MSRRLRAVFRFQTSDDTREGLMSPLKILLRTLRLLRFRDPHATLKITPDDGEPVFYDPEGD